MTAPASIAELLQERAARRGRAAAILSPGRSPLSYAALLQQAERTTAALRALGIGGGDRVAVMLPNGPEMATAVVSVAAGAVCAPLNPGGGGTEFESCLRRLAPRAIVLEARGEAAAETALRLGVRVLRLGASGDIAGRFELEDGGAGLGIGRVHAAPGDVGTGAGDVALLLHTSGTTSQPRIVPLSPRNVLAAARSIARTLALAPEDRCLNILPLFHAHGLMAALLATLDAGGSVVCTDGAYGARVLPWLEEFRPSWYTAVPTMHRSVLRQARDGAEAVRLGRLRLVRSASAPLPSGVRRELEEVFRVPVIEAYGMTEASHQIASNPLPPAPRKLGSVGPAAGAEIAIIDETGEPLPPGATGEVAIRGESVTAGYLAEGTAGAGAFIGGWFRTGDLGHVDDDGYLYLAGRLRELINRGGEKIAPREVDEVLLGHPAVVEALAFAVTHRQLGEEVGAIVELKAPGAADERELRRHAAGALPAFKTPRVIRIVDRIPRGPTGKLERIGLAAKLGIPELDDDAPAEHVEPRNEIERRLAALWQELLHVERVGVRDRFAALGGDSLLAVNMLLKVGEQEEVDAAFVGFLEEGTIESLAVEVEEWQAGRRAGAGLVAIQRRGRRRPLICVPGHDGVLVGIARLARALGPEQPVWTFPLGEPARAVADLARRGVEELRALDGAGPYRLAGACFGGLIAFEMARQLEASGDRVELLALIDTLNPAWWRALPARVIGGALARQWRVKARCHATALRGMSVAQAARYLGGRVAAFLRNHTQSAGARALRIRRAPPDGRSPVTWARRRMALEYRPDAYGGDALVVTVRGRRLAVSALGWRDRVRGKLEEIEVPFHPEGALAGDNAARVAGVLSERLRP